MSNDKEILELLSANRPPCIDTLNGKATQFVSDPPSLKMEFEAVPEFCHSPNQVVQGGFVTGMLDTSMAHLLIALSGGKRRQSCPRQHHNRGGHKERPYLRQDHTDRGLYVGGCHAPRVGYPGVLDRPLR